MAITIDWPTKVINVPKNDLTLIQSTPTEIRELDLNWFRLTLRDLEDDTDGMPFPRTHKHNTEVQLGGLTFARVVEIINDYTVTFEDGQYAVNLVGANSNVGDVVNVNQVSVRSQNSAGLISSPDIEYASFRGGVIVDVNSGISGTVFPRGTERMKVNNISDAILIADYRGFNKIYLHSDITLDSNAVLNQYVLEGRNHVETDVIIQSDAQVEGVTIIECSVSGVLDGGTVLSYCVVESINYLNGHIHTCSLYGTITLGGDEDAYVVNCNQLDANLVPGIDMGGSGQDLIMPDYIGDLEISNLTGDNKVGIGLSAGKVILKSTVSSGVIQISGIGRLVDESDNDIPSGTWNGGVTIINTLVNNHEIERAVWDALDDDHAAPGSMGDRINDIYTRAGIAAFKL